jgi:hypothetical protein
MLLTSGLFKDNKQLQDCARLDTAHLVADEPPLRRGENNQGDHVALIHRALRQILPSPSFGLEEATETYGPKTAKIIRQFKAAQKPPLLNKALGQTVPDNIVGKQTIAALDREVSRKKQPPGGGSGGPANSQAFTVVPFTETSPFLISQQLDSRTEDDLEFTARAPRVNQQQALQNVGVARSLPTAALEAEMFAELSGGGQIGRDMGSIFVRKLAPGQEEPFANDSALSKAVRASSNFPPANTKVRDEITKVFKASIASRKVVDFHDLAASTKVITPPMMDKGFSFFADRKLKFAIGGLKGVELFISKFDASVTPRRWSATLIYNFLDHFGINDSDLIFDGRGHGSFGQAGTWVMQHERHPGHFPFISRIFVEIDVTDSL